MRNHDSIERIIGDIMCGESKKFCTNCGSEILGEAKFCINCGTKIEVPIVENDSRDVFLEIPETVIPVAEEEQVETEIDIHYEEEEPVYSAGIEPVNVEGNGNIGFAIASMVCGILSIVCCCIYMVDLILAIAAIVLGFIAIKEQYEGKGMAIAGIITGGIGILIWLVLLVLGGIMVSVEEILEF